MARGFSAPLERTSRLLDLVPYISSHQGVALEELAKVFEVSKQQMVSDLTTLWMCGLPGYTPLELMDLDFESGFVTIHNAGTLARPRSISFEEGVALLLGLDLLRSTIPQDRDDLLNQIDSLSQRISQASDVPEMLSASAPVQADVSVAIAKALSTQSGLAITYHSLYRDEITQRRIFPIEIVDMESGQYLSAYCYAVNEFRHFKTDRIVSAESAAVEAISADIGSEPSKISYTVRVVSSSREAAERFNQESLVVGCNFASASYSQQWILRSIMASGGALELLSPLDVRKTIALKAQSMLDRYRSL